MDNFINTLEGWNLYAKHSTADCFEYQEAKDKYFDSQWQSLTITDTDEESEV